MRYNFGNVQIGDFDHVITRHLEYCGFISTMGADGAGKATVSSETIKTASMALLNNGYRYGRFSRLAKLRPFSFQI